jgi:hypothetical protein
MMAGAALIQNGKWKVRASIFLLLIVPLYVFPSALRVLFLGHAGWLAGLLISDVLPCLVAGFLTNSYRFAVGLYLGSTVLEALLLLVLHQPILALWIGDLIPALVAIYFAQQIYINMGD